MDSTPPSGGDDHRRHPRNLAAGDGATHRRPAVAWPVPDSVLPPPELSLAPPLGVLMPGEVVPLDPALWRTARPEKPRPDLPPEEP
jgi:hypothetical protein